MIRRRRKVILVKVFSFLINTLGLLSHCVSVSAVVVTERYDSSDRSCYLLSSLVILLLAIVDVTFESCCPTRKTIVVPESLLAAVAKILHEELPILPRWHIVISIDSTISTIIASRISTIDPSPGVRRLHQSVCIRRYRKCGECRIFLGCGHRRCRRSGIKCYRN